MGRRNVPEVAVLPRGASHRRLRCSISTSRLLQLTTSPFSRVTVFGTMAMQRPLEVSIFSAKGLKNVNFFSKLEVYAEAWLSNDPNNKQRTPVDREGGRNPSWKGANLKFFIPDGVDTGGLILSIVLRCESVLGYRDIGEVKVPVRDLELSAGKSDRIVTYEVRRPSGRAKGSLNFSVKIGEPTAAPPPTAYDPAPYPAPPAHAYPPIGTAYPHGAENKGDHPVTAYPAGPSAAYPPPQGYPMAYPPQGYGAPPPGYGYPPPPAYGYGAPPVVQPQKPKKNKLGLGLGAGLLGGALGGLLIGDMISDAADYGDGYDAGFGDAGGFDF